MTNRRRQLEDVVARIQAIAIEHPRARLARALSGLAGQLGIHRRRPFLRRRYRRLVWPRLLQDLQAALTHSYLPLYLAGLGVALVAPVVWRGWGTADDVLQRQVLLSSSFSTAVIEQFRFLHPSVNAGLKELGVIPWWTLGEIRISFFRPLSTLTHWLDYQLWPDSHELMHVHSLLWYGGLCALVTVFYRRLLGRVPAAGLAAFAFSGSIIHLNFLHSIAGRNVVLAGFFGLLTLCFHDRWRRGGRRNGALLALLSMILALFSAEAGVATVAYLVAYAVFLDSGTWRRRLGTLVPYGIIVVVWRLAYQYLGYGAWGAGFYVDPGREPLRFAAAVIENGPMLLFGKWVLLEPALYGFVAGWASWLLWLLAVVSLVFVSWVMLPLLRKSRVARFWAMGMLLAVIPACAVSLPSGRLVLFIEFGALGLIAQIIDGIVSGADWLPARPSQTAAARLLAFLLLGMHVILSPLLTPALHGAHDFMGAAAELGPLEGVESQYVVIVNAPSPGQFIYTRNVRMLRGQTVPARLRLLAPGYGAVIVTRVDDRTVLVQPAYGYIAPPGIRALSSMNPLQPAHNAYGYRHGDMLFGSPSSEVDLAPVELSGMSAEFTELQDNGRPAEARVQFHVSLEDPSLCWLRWDWVEERYVSFNPPAIGETVYVPGPF